ncbi:hypothetical protein JCM16303_003095 [Sporobolomyces ruberrimus]
MSIRNVFDDFDIDEEIRKLKRADQQKYVDRRKELEHFLKNPENGIGPPLRKHMIAVLDSPGNPGWNYYHDRNWERVTRMRGGVLNRKRKDTFDFRGYGFRRSAFEVSLSGFQALCPTSIRAESYPS